VEDCFDTFKLGSLLLSSADRVGSSHSPNPLERKKERRGKEKGEERKGKRRGKRKLERKRKEK
jgi:hypothetical protein